MDKVLRPERLDIDLDDKSDAASSKYKHWKVTMDNFFANLGKLADTDAKQYTVLVNFVSPQVFTTISDVDKYTEAIKILTSLFVKEKNVNFARFCLSKRV